MKRFISLTAVMATVLALGACGGGTDTASDVECLDVPQEVLDTVASGSDNAGFAGQAGKAVKGDTDGTYWLAMKFTADGFDGESETGVWLVSGLDAATVAPVMSVDAFAKRFTHWPTQINGTELNGTEDNAKAAKECLAG